MHDTRVDELVIGLLASGRPRSQAQILQGLLPLLRDAVPRGDLDRGVVDSLDRLEAAGEIERTRRRALATATGRARSIALFGGDPFATRIKYRLLARALGLGPRQPVIRLGRVDGLRSEILRRHHDLPLPALSPLPQVEQALGWQLLAKGANPEVIRLARRRGSFGSELVLASLTLTEAGITTLPEGTPSVLLARGIRLLAAQAVGQVDADGLALQRTLIGGWVTRSLSLGAPSAASFADRALAAALRIERPNRIGEHLVFVSHAHRSYNEAEIPIPLELFKKQLLAAHRRQELWLQGAEMPQVLDPSDLEASTVTYRRSRFCFIRTPPRKTGP